MGLHQKHCDYWKLILLRTADNIRHRKSFLSECVKKIQIVGLFGFFVNSGHKWNLLFGSAPSIMVLGYYLSFDMLVEISYLMLFNAVLI